MAPDERTGRESSPRPAPFRVEKALAGAEPAPDSPEARRALAEARAEGDRFLARYPTWRALKDSRDGDRGEGRARRRARLLAFRPRAWLAAAAALALCVLTARLALAPGRDGGPGGPGDLALKGGPHFSMLVGGRPALAGRESPAFPGDTVQLFLHHDRPLHYAVFYRDDGGPWELYFASAGAEPASPRGAPLAHGVLLAPGWRVEEIAALAGTQPPGGAGRDCLPKAWTPETVEAAPAHCRDFTVNLFRLRQGP